MDRIKALNILGLDVNATDSDIESRYSILLKRHDQIIRDKGAYEEEHFKLQTQAYAFLTGTDYKENGNAQNAKEQKLNASNIWYYYKYFFIIIPIALIFFGYMLADAFFKPKPDVRVVFAGEIFGISTDMFEKAVMDNVPEAGLIEANIISYKDVDLANIMLNREKIFLELTMGKDDIVFLDRNIFESYVAEGVFIQLDDILKDNINPGSISKLNNNNALWVKAAGDTTEHIYGIDVSANNIFSKNDIYGDVIILAVRAKGRLNESVAAFIAYITGIENIDVETFNNIK